jgi:hypothetical protein
MGKGGGAVITRACSIREVAQGGKHYLLRRIVGEVSRPRSSLRDAKHCPPLPRATAARACSRQAMRLISQVLWPVHVVSPNTSKADYFLVATFCWSWHPALRS